MHTIWLDLRFAARMLAKSPGFALIAITALSIGIGVNVTLFGFVNALVLRPLPVPSPERLVRADSGPTAGIMRSLPESEYLEYRDRNQSFEELAFFTGGGVRRVEIDGITHMISVSPVSGNYFETLGVTAAHGRLVTERDDETDAAAVVVLSHEGVRRFFDGDPGVLGDTILIDSEPATIVGVTPETFKGTVYPNVPQMFSTYRFTRARRADPPGYLFGRLRDGVTATEADADLKRIASQLRAETGAPKTIATYPATAHYPNLVTMLQPLGALIGAILLVVLWIACVNVAMLLVARAAARRREVGIRIAMGASRGALIRQFAIESLLLSTLAGAGASYIAHVTSEVLSHVYLPVPAPIAAVYALDWRAVAFAFAVSLAATFVFGVTPAREALRTDVVSAVTSSDHASGTGRAGRNFQHIVAQIAASTALLAMAAIMVRSIHRPPDLKLDVDGVMTAPARLPAGLTPERQAAMVESVLERLEAVSGVSSATALRHIPQTRNQGEHVPVTIFPAEREPSHRDGARPLVYDNLVTRGHFRTLGIPILSGRDFEVRDGPAAPLVAIVNVAYAERFWPGESPVGRALTDASGRTLTVVGLVGNSKYRWRDEELAPFVYLPLSQAPFDSPTFLVKSTLPQAEVANHIRDQVAVVDPDVAVYNIRTLDDRLTLGVHVALAWIAGVLGLFGALVGTLGTYGIMAWRVQERQREFGIRVALGATRSGIVRLTTRDGMRSTLWGLALGLSAFVIGGQFLQSLFRGVSPFDPLAFAAVASLLGSISYLSCWLPARRQSKASPLAALRE